MNCKVNERVALNQNDTLQLALNNNVICAKADMTRKHELANKYLSWAGNKGQGIPYLAIIPAGRADEPITFNALVTKKQILEALEKAGASRID